MNPRNAVSIRKLCKEYKSSGGSTNAIKTISLDIDNGEFLMITGRNGSGKSTLMHLMALLDSPTSGDVYIDGSNTTNLSDWEKRNLRLKTFGYIFQEHALLQEHTALQNVMLPALTLNSFSKASRMAKILLKKVYLDHKLKRLPSELSGGEQQRVAIARSLINNPKIIFADEPTANLDSVASKEVLEIFKKLNTEEGITIIMVTHEPEELAYATKVINLMDGKIDEK
jgi:putative ABC transport system ATP-binding protein